MKPFLGIFGRRLFMVLAALSLVLLGSVGFVGYWHARNTIIENASCHLYSVAFNRAKELDHWFEERRLEITLIANLPQVKSSVKRIVNGAAAKFNLRCAVAAGQ